MPGDYTEGETPDPIPNSEVKPLRADGSDSARDRESRSSPGFFFSPSPRSIPAANAPAGLRLRIARLAYCSVRGGSRSVGSASTGAFSLRNGRGNGEKRWFATVVGLVPP